MKEASLAPTTQPNILVPVVFHRQLPQEGQPPVDDFYRNLPDTGEYDIYVATAFDIDLDPDKVYSYAEIHQMGIDHKIIATVIPGQTKTQLPQWQKQLVPPIAGTRSFVKVEHRPPGITRQYPFIDGPDGKRIKAAVTVLSGELIS